MRGVHAIDQITGSALQVMEGPVHGVLIAPQTASDAPVRCASTRSSPMHCQWEGAARRTIRENCA